MMALSDGRKSFRIRLAVLIQYRSVTDTQPPSQPPSHVAVAITLNALAKASSLKIGQRLRACGATLCQKLKFQLLRGRVLTT